MAEPDLLNAFDDCIARLAAGQSIDDCLRRYPQYASTLRPILEAGRLVNRARFSPAEIRESQNRVRFRVAQSIKTRPTRSRALLLRTLPLVASFVIMLALTLGATTILAENSLPGDPLYGLKRLTESVRLSIAADRNAIESQFDERRITEIEQLLAQRRAAEVTFEGELEGTNNSVWSVAGLSVQVAPDTPGAASARVGDILEIQASTTDEGQIVATNIRRISEGLPSVPTAVPTTEIPTQKPSPTVTPSPSPTSRPTLPAQAQPSPTSCVASQPQGWVVYRVQPGDNLSTLAATTGTTLERLTEVNCLTDRSLIVTGQHLYLPVVPQANPTQASPQVRPTEDRGDDNSGPGSNNSGNGGDDDDERGGEDNSASDGNDDNSGRGSDD